MGFARIITGGIKFLVPKSLLYQQDGRMNPGPGPLLMYPENQRAHVIQWYVFSRLVWLFIIECALNATGTDVISIRERCMLNGT